MCNLQPHEIVGMTLLGVLAIVMAGVVGALVSSIWFSELFEQEKKRLMERYGK